VSLTKEDLVLIRQQLEGLRDASSPDPNPERRRAPRVRHSARVRMCREKEIHFDTGITVALHDISDIGLGVFYDQRLKKGERFVITIENPGSPSLWVLCSVARCQWWAEKTYLIGLRMLAMADPFGRKKDRDDGLLSGE
jgi:hypothetical protein